MKFRAPLLMVVLLLAARTVLQAQNSVEGHVVLPKSHSAAVINKRYLLNGEAAIIQPDPPAAVVYLEGTFPLPKPATVQMPQKNIAFEMTLLPVLVGTRVEFPNLDDTYHNIFSYSKPKRFDLGRYRGDERPVPSEVFDQPGVVALHCDIHETMHAIILVLETPHFALTDAEGNYHLAGLPAGHYQLKAWINSKTTLVHEVDLQPGKTLQVNFP
ncbi:MAG: carboxypeptidase regulatory-like domain-containing protein [Chthoniobacteraceae bacterium]